MTIPRALAGAALLALAVAGCSSSDDSGSAGTPAAAAPTAPTSGATTPAATSAKAGGAIDRSKDCPDAIAAAKAALAGLSVTDVSLPEGCTVVYIKTPLTDPKIGVDMCQKVAGEVYQLGIVGIAVESDGGKSLAIGAPSQECMPL